MFKYLEFIVTKLEFENDKALKPIVDEAKKLQQRLPNESKKKIIRGLSKVLAKIQQHGIKFLLEFWDVAKKELMKKALTGGFHEIGQLLNNGF